MVKDANLSDKPSHLRSRRRRGRRQKRTKGARARRVFKTQRLRNGRKLLFQPLAPLTPGSRPQTEVGFRPHKAQSVPQHRAKSRAPRYGKCAGACSNRPTVEEFVLRDQPRGLRRPRQTLPEITHTHNNNNKKDGGGGGRGGDGTGRKTFPPRLFGRAMPANLMMMMK